MKKKLFIIIIICSFFSLLFYTNPLKSKHIDVVTENLMSGKIIKGIADSSILNNTPDEDIYNEGSLKNFKQLAQRTITEQIVNTLSYKNYYLFSITKSPKNKIITIGFFNKIFLL